MDNKNNLLIFDWDDTLLPSSELYKISRGQSAAIYECKIADTERAILQNIDSLAEICITKASLVGTVVIVTNADKGWVEITGSTFLPKTYKKMMELNIPVVSAAHLYMSKSKSATDWKYYTFLDILSGKNFSNIISVGDSKCEKEALMRIESVLGNSANFKTIKLAEFPRYKDLINQLKIISNIITKVFVDDLCKNHSFLK